MNDETTKIKPPYLSYTTFANFLASVKAGVVPSRIDKSFMPGQSGTTQSYLISALKFFGLIDDKGTPQPDLHALIDTEGDERKAVLKRLILASYKPIISGLDLERATLGQLHEKFTQQDLNGETVRKCHSFFAAAADAAGILLAPHLKPKARGSGARRQRKAKSAQNGAPPAQENEPAHIPGTARQIVATLPLNEDGSRKVVLHAPPTITKAELERIKGWMTFQFIVDDAGK